MVVSTMMVTILKKTLTQINSVADTIQGPVPGCSLATPIKINIIKTATIRINIKTLTQTATPLSNNIKE